MFHPALDIVGSPAENVMTHIWRPNSSYNSSVIHVLFPPQRTYLTDRFTFSSVVSFLVFLYETHQRIKNVLKSVLDLLNKIKSFGKSFLKYFRDFAEIWFNNSKTEQRYILSDKTNQGICIEMTLEKKHLVF